MARVLLAIMMICACFCVTGCKKKESATDTKTEQTKRKAHKVTDEAESTVGLMNDMQ